MKQYPGYTVVRCEDCPEQHGTLTVLTHDVRMKISSETLKGAYFLAGL